MFGALEQAVEVVGEYGRLAFRSCHAEGTSQEIGDERRVVGLLRQRTVIDGEHDDAFEVEASGLEYTHHL